MVIASRFLSFCSIVATASLMGHVAIGADASGAAPSPPILTLANGDFVAGQLLDSRQADILRWQGRGFVSEFEFAVSGVSSISFPAVAQRPKPVGDFCFELAGGDVLFGSLSELSSEEVAVDVPHFGLLHIRRENVTRILRWHDGTDLIHLGPNGLGDWDEPSHQAQWREDAGHLVTDEVGATISSRFHLPDQVSIEFEVSWTVKPDFVLSLGVGAQEDDSAVRLEVWGSNLVLLHESDTEADLASLMEINAGKGRAHFKVYLDRQRGQALAFSDNGNQLADLSFAGGDSASPCGIRLVNKGGDVRLERLRVAGWNGESPKSVQTDRSRLQLSDRSVVYGDVTGFDAAANEFIVNGQRRLNVEQVRSIVSSQAKDVPPREIRAVFQDGSCLSGQLLTVVDGQLCLNCPSVVELLGLPVSELRTLLVPDHQLSSPSKAGQVGRLEMDGVRLRGSLVGSNSEGEGSCLIWRPHGSATASALQVDASARIVYRDPPPELQAATAAAPRRGGGGFLGELARALAGAASAPAVVQASRRFSPSLYLRTGDTIPCEVQRIDQRGVTFRSPTFDATFVPHDKIKAVELENRSNAVKVDRAKRDRLLTLPRMQKDNPPTHLIRSTAGDYLRARLTEMDDTTLTAEVRLEPRYLPRQNISQIIWLHEDELLVSDRMESPVESSTAGRVQAIRNDGIRLTFAPETLSETTLSGTSDVLGPCRVVLRELDQLLIGGAIGGAAPELPYQRWKLRYAVEPKFVTAGGQSVPRTPGADSALVGQPAPDFELERLDGQTFRLSDSRGSVVVLDFWATWCGPCIQAMPHVDRVVGEFQEQGVQLIAVNLQETSDAITATLQRLGLETTVALDRDGAVAEKYAAAAIPQTVIIDTDGNVARLFVGGGPQFPDQLRDALLSVLDSTDDEATPSSLSNEQPPSSALPRQ